MSFSAAWWSLFAPISVQLVPLGIVIALVDRFLLRRVRAEWRAAVWALLFLKLVLPPSWQGSWAPVGLLPDLVSQAYSGAKFAGAHDQPWIPVAFAVWLTVFASVIGFGAWRSLRNTPRKSQLRPACQRTRSTAKRIAHSLGLRVVPTIQISKHIHGPCVVGILRPRILLPEGLRTRSNELEHILAHELCHVRRADPLRGLILFLLHAAFWFHPVVWLAHRQLGLLREQSCDLEAARVTGSPEEYRETLLTLTAQRHGLRPSAGLGFLPRSRILARLENLERAGTRLRAPLGLHCLVLTLVLGAGCLPMTQVPLPSAWDTAVDLDELPGCLPARFLVLRELAKQ